MYSLFLSILSVNSLLIVSAPLRVCADPANLPFSNRAGQGFDNRIASLIARDLHRRVDFVWMPETKNFVRKTLGASKCDVLMGVPEGMPDVLTTAPYYRSTYVLLSRGPKLSGIDDPALRKMRIGVQVAGDDYTPPAAALARRGLSANLHGYPLKGDDLFAALRRGEIDVAVAWGPAAGYAARHSPVRFAVTPLPMSFALAAAVRKSDAGLQREIGQAISRESAGIRRTLDEYGVPQL